VTDISVKDEDTLVGERWYEFLLRCKYTIGVEGGASILDSDGSIKAATEAYLEQHPQAPFEEVEAHCFAGRDGTARLYAISPRHLEACATRTCQVLVEGDYNGILKPGVHYVELKRDFSNLDAVAESIRQDGARRETTERAYRDVVLSGANSYERFVKCVLHEALPSAGRGGARARVWLVARRSEWAAGSFRLGLAWEKKRAAAVHSLPPWLRFALRQGRRVLRREA
jgi:hypothetical protein